jgi:hypothetical protein
MSATEQRQNTTIAPGKRTTPFGAIENPNLVSTLPAKGVLRVDSLACLKTIWGDNILMSRQHLYEIVSGTVSDEVLRKLLVSYYNRYAAFANYVDSKFFFEEQNESFLRRIIRPARALIDEYAQSAIARSKWYRGTYLGTHCDYLYFLFQGETTPDFEESCRLC